MSNNFLIYRLLYCRSSAIPLHADQLKLIVENSRPPTLIAPPQCLKVCLTRRLPSTMQSLQGNDCNTHPPPPPPHPPGTTRGLSIKPLCGLSIKPRWYLLPYIDTLHFTPELRGEEKFNLFIIIMYWLEHAVLWTKSSSCTCITLYRK